MDKYQKYDPKLYKCPVTVAWEHGNHAAIEYKTWYMFLRDKSTKSLLEIVEVHGNHMWTTKKMMELTNNFTTWRENAKWYSD